MEKGRKQIELTDILCRVGTLHPGTTVSLFIPKKKRVLNECFSQYFAFQSNILLLFFVFDRKRRNS
jgi:hypothetical protein